MTTTVVTTVGPVEVYINGIAHCFRCHTKLAGDYTAEELTQWIAEHQHDMTDAQRAKITTLGGDPEEFLPAFDLPAGWFAGWGKGVYYGVSPEGAAHS